MVVVEAAAAAEGRRNPVEEVVDMVESDVEIEQWEEAIYGWRCSSLTKSSLSGSFRLCFNYTLSQN